MATNNNLLGDTTPTNEIPNWQYNVIPGNANQGAILMTRSPIGNPPLQMSDLIWKAMEDIIGVANVKLEYEEEEGVYHLYKATGHVDNNGDWTYTWEEFGTWEALTEEMAETLRALVYVEYVYDTSQPNTLVVKGIKKDGTEEQLVSISFASTQYVDTAVANLQRQIDANEPKAGTAISIVQLTDPNNGKQISVKYNTDDFTIDSSGNLKANLIQDSLTTSTIKTYSIDKILDLIKYHWRYMGEVQDKTLLPINNSRRGEVYGIINEADLYVNISNNTVPNWYPFTYVAEAFQAYGVELHKGTNGLYARLRYDTIDFAIDNALNLKSQLIDDTLDASDTYANRKTYSIDKILSLLSSSMRYKGQVNYYDLLPSTGNVAGDTWNVKYVGTSSQASTELDGDNYCWNGTSWDDLSGEYRAGVGIQIVGKTISSTGINFRVGSGVQIIGSGENAVLETRNGNGIEYQNVGTTADPVYANAVKPYNGINVDTNGVSAKISNGLEFDSNTNIKVKPYNGIIVDNNGVSLKHNTDIVINANNEATVPIKTINGNDVHGSGNINTFSYLGVTPTYDSNWFRLDQTSVLIEVISDHLFTMQGQTLLKTYPAYPTRGTVLMTLDLNFPIQSSNIYITATSNTGKAANVYIPAGTRNVVWNADVYNPDPISADVPYTYWVFNSVTYLF